MEEAIQKTTALQRPSAYNALVSFLLGDKENEKEPEAKEPEHIVIQHIPT